MDRLQLFEELRRHLNLGVGEEPEGPPFNQLADAWWTQVGCTQGRARTTVWLLQPLQRHLGEIPSMQLKPAVAPEYDLARQIEGRRGGGALAAGTVDAELALLRTILRWAVSKADPTLIPRNPFDGWRSRKERKRKGSVHTEEQLQRLCDECPIWVRAIILALAYTGARVRVILHLQWADIDEKTGHIRTPEDSATKKRGNPRLLTIVRAAFALLPRSGSPWVFPSPRKEGQPYSYTQLRFYWDRACARAGVSTADGKAVMHHLRHGFALRAFEEWGWSVKQVMDRGGWSTFESVMRYGALTRETKDAAHDHADQLTRQRWTSIESKRLGPRSSVFRVRSQQSSANPKK